MVRTARKSLHVLALTVSASLLAAGCSGDRATGTSTELGLGTYTLLSVEDDPVPSTLIQTPDYLLQITGGTLTLNADRSYTGSLDFRENDDGRVTSETIGDVGVYTRTNNAFTFVSSRDETTATGSLSGNTMTVIDSNGFSLVFRK